MTPREALRSKRGERLAHAALLRADAGQPGSPARRDLARARHRAVGLVSAAVGAAPRASRPAAPTPERAATVLSGRAGRAGWARVRDTEVQNAQTRCGGPARPVSRRRARAPHEGGDDGHRRLVARDAARRGAAAAERPPRRHEPGRTASDPPAVLRRARGTATRLLAAARGQARPHRLRAGAPRL